MFFSVKFRLVSSWGRDRNGDRVRAPIGPSVLPILPCGDVSRLSLPVTLEFGRYAGVAVPVGVGHDVVSLHPIREVRVGSEIIL